MRRLLTACAGLALYMLCYSVAFASGGPLDVTLREYGLTLATALLGGLVSWLHGVRSGRTSATNLMGLVGELCTSAFAGLLAFWTCRSLDLDPMKTAVVAGIAGHMGTRAILAIEREIRRRAGIGDDEPGAANGR